jgi:hypothetical protein
VNEGSELGMPLEIRDDIRTNRHDSQAPGPGEIERSFGQKTSDSLMPASRRHLRVVQIQPAGAVVVIFQERDAFRKANLETVCRRVVFDPGRLSLFESAIVRSREGRVYA